LTCTYIAILAEGDADNASPGFTLTH
jgi:hypothetical protein